MFSIPHGPENDFLAEEVSKGVQRCVGDTMLRAPVGSKFKTLRAERGSTLAKRRPARYEGQHDLEDDELDATGVWKLAPNLDKGGPCTCIVADKHGRARLSTNPSRLQRAEETRIVRMKESNCNSALAAAIPNTNQAPKTKALKHPRAIPEELAKAFAAEVHSYDDLVPLATLRKFAKAVQAANDLAEEARRMPNNQTTIAYLHHKRQVVTFFPNEFTEIAQRVLAAGFSMATPIGGKPKIMTMVEMPNNAWGYDRDKLLYAARKAKYKDEDLLQSLQFGFSDRSHCTPPVSVFIGPSPSALLNPSKLTQSVQEEAGKGWIGEAKSRPTTIPFVNPPAGLVAKRGTEKLRLIWNASFPRSTQKAGMIEVNGSRLPLSANFNTMLPAEMKFSWTSTDDINIALHVLAEVAMQKNVELLGTTLDFKSWFRMHQIALAELWKCWVFWDGSFRHDRRMQMGRASAAHNAQAASFLVVHIILIELERRQVGTGKRNDKLKRWIQARKMHFPNDIHQCRPYSVQIFQDDLILLAAGKDIANELYLAAKAVINKLGIILSDKPEANRPFSTRFEALGALYDTSDLRNIKVRPADRSVQKASEAADLFRINENSVITREQAESAVGSLGFAARFAHNGRAFMNSIYSTLTVPTATKFDMVPVSAKAAEHARNIMERINSAHLKTMIAKTEVTYLGSQFLTCDASGAFGKGGWGLCNGGILGYGKWTSAIQRAFELQAISITHLELAALIMLTIFRSEHRQQASLTPIIAQWDNASVVLAANFLRTSNTGMARLVQELVRRTEKNGEEFAFVHITTEKNSIADALSRGNIAVAKERATALFGKDKVLFKQPSVAVVSVVHFMDMVARDAMKQLHRQEDIGEEIVPDNHE